MGGVRHGVGRRVPAIWRGEPYRPHRYAARRRHVIAESAMVVASLALALGSCTDSLTGTHEPAPLTETLDHRSLEPGRDDHDGAPEETPHPEPNAPDNPAAPEETPHPEASAPDNPAAPEETPHPEASAPDNPAAPEIASTAPDGGPLTLFPVPFPTAALQDLPDHPVPRGLAQALQAQLDRYLTPGRGGGVSAAVISADHGVWAGVAGSSGDGAPLSTAHRFPVGGLSEAVVAAMVMRLVEVGLLELDDSVGERLPTNLSFVSNGATVRDLLGMRSGLRDVPRPDREDPRRSWHPAEVLARVPEERFPPGTTMEYSGINYLLLGMVVEGATGRPVAEALRRGVLDEPGLDGLVVQPAEPLTGPVALPFTRHGTPRSLVDLGGAVPSRNEVTLHGAGRALAADATSLARWWGLLCGGHLVSQGSLSDMTSFDPDRWSWNLNSYGFGLLDLSESDDAPAVGALAKMPGYRAHAHCRVADGVVAATLLNRNAGFLEATALAMDLSRTAADAAAPGR